MKSKPLSKTQKKIIIFYTLYFSYLFVFIYLVPNENILTYYAASILAFYLLFLKSKGDFFWIFWSVLVILFVAMVKVKGFYVSFDVKSIYSMPKWLPLVWVTTILALRKFYLMTTKGKETGILF